MDTRKSATSGVQNHVFGLLLYLVHVLDFVSLVNGYHVHHLRIAIDKRNILIRMFQKSHLADGIYYRCLL